MPRATRDVPSVQSWHHSFFISSMFCVVIHQLITRSSWPTLLPRLASASAEQALTWAMAALKKQASACCVQTCVWEWRWSLAGRKGYQYYSSKSSCSSASSCSSVTEDNRYSFVAVTPNAAVKELDRSSLTRRNNLRKSVGSSLHVSRMLCTSKGCIKVRRSKYREGKHSFYHAFPMLC